MSNLDSLLGNLVTMGTLYGWRVDAMLVGGLLWTLMTLMASAHLAPWSPPRRVVTVAA